MKRIILILILMLFVISCAKKEMVEKGGIKIDVVSEPLAGDMEKDINELEDLEEETDESEVDDINFEDITF